MDNYPNLQKNVKLVELFLNLQASTWWLHLYFPLGETSRSWILLLTTSSLFRMCTSVTVTTQSLKNRRPWTQRHIPHLSAFTAHTTVETKKQITHTLPPFSPKYHTSLTWIYTPTNMQPPVQSLWWCQDILSFIYSLNSFIYPFMHHFPLSFHYKWANCSVKTNYSAGELLTAFPLQICK